MGEIPLVAVFPSSVASTLILLLWSESEEDAAGVRGATEIGESVFRFEFAEGLEAGSGTRGGSDEETCGII